MAKTKSGKTQLKKVSRRVGKVYMKYKKLPGSIRKPVNFIADTAGKVATGAAVTAASAYGGPVAGIVAGSAANYAHKRIRQKLGKIKVQK